ncbi:hypothetical protein GCM10010129_41330 [Streptomyces fumigatiscleroticus]|nr:hypothetical protein GCM10010129_41330 [Streptomyces fumigatiscleroticus]
MARCTGRHRWWRPLLGTLLVAGGWLVLIAVLDTLAYGIGKAAGRPELPDGTIDFGPVVNTALDLTYIAVSLPLVLLAVGWTGRRPAGTVSSVAGRLRGRWLARCLLAGVPALVLLALAAWLMPDGDTGSGPPAEWVGWQTFLVSVAALVLLVPVQAAAEEYVFRGWLLQAAGGFLRSPWLAALPQAALFAAAHGWGTPWGFADLLVFGMVAAWLTVRTGGLEASVALHALNNLLAFGLSAAVVDGLSSDETAADSPWQFAVVDTLVTLVYAAVVLWSARRRPPQRVAAPAPPAVPRSYWPYGGGYGVGGPYPPPPYGTVPGPPWGGGHAGWQPPADGPSADGTR